MAVRLKLVLAAGLSLWSACSAGDPSASVQPGQQPGGDDVSTPPQIERACTVDELLPLPCSSKSSEWADDNPVEPAYNCTCATIKGRYYCPSQNGVEYPTWVPQAAAQSVCRAATRAAMVETPFPPNSKIFFYGNSHLRQVVEGMMCMFQGALTSKTVFSELENSPQTVSGDTQCRTCWNARQLLVDGCVAKGDTCKCNDDHGEFFFENGAVVHFTFSDQSPTKCLEEARQSHGSDDLASYDVVVANEGNPPRLTSNQAVEMALQVQAAGAQLFWLSTYAAGGDVATWNEQDRERFVGSGAKHVDVGCMMQGMYEWTIGAVKNSPDDHFCMPGPSDEVSVLLAQLVWALHEESS